MRWARPCVHARVVRLLGFGFVVRRVIRLVVVLVERCCPNDNVELSCESGSLQTFRSLLRRYVCVSTPSVVSGIVLTSCPAVFGLNSC